MLTFFRRGLVAKLMLLILGLVLVAIVITGFGAGGMGLGELGALRGGGIAKVGSEPVTADELTAEAERQLGFIRQQQPEIDMASFVRQGGVDQLLDQLMVVSGNIVFGREHGLAATRAMVDREIASIPAFQNAAGQFDENVFRQALANQKVSERQLRREVERRLIQRQLLWPMHYNAAMPQTIASRYAALLLETRTGSGGVVPTALMAGGAAPTDAEVAAFYRSNIARYTVPERRVIRYAPFGLDAVAAQSRATDAEIQQAYQARASEFAGREERNLEQVVFQSEAEAKAFAQKLAGGTPFEKAAAESGRASSDIAVGNQTKEAFAKLASPAVAAAAFAAAKGGNTAPVKSPLGWHIVHVVAVNQIAGKPLAAVRDQLAAEVEQRKGADALADLAGKIDDAVSKGASFDEVVKANHLTVAETPAITAAGTNPDDPKWVAAPEVRAALQTAFQMAPEDDAQVVPVEQNKSNALVSLAKVVPAAAPPLAQIADRVKADFVQTRGLERARAIAAAIVAKINAGMAPAQAMAGAGVKLPGMAPLSAVRKDLSQRGGQVPPPLAALFSLTPRKAKMVPAPNGQGWLIVYLDKVVPGDPSKEPALSDAVRNQLGQAITLEYDIQFSNDILGGMKTRRNEKAIADLKARLSNSGGGGQ